LSRKALNAVQFFDHGGYGVDAEMLSLAEKNSITIAEVPVTVRYKGLKKTSKKTPLTHGGELIGSLLRMVIEESPLKYLGIPGATLLIIGMLAAIYMVLGYNSTKLISLHSMIISMGSTVVGLLLIVTAFILFGLQKIRKRINDLGMFRNSNDVDEDTK